MHVYSCVLLAITAYDIAVMSTTCVYIDIDECSSSPCNHTCTNTVGSFVCSCNDGYELDDDGTTCNGMFNIVRT